MDHTEENLDERQEDEVEALKSIYDCDFDDLRKQANIRKPLVLWSSPLYKWPAANSRIFLNWPSLQK